MHATRHALAALALLAAACTPGSPPAVDAPAPARREFQMPAGAVAMPDLQAAMRDGVRLRTSVWLPGPEGQFPVVLIRTPYETEMRPFWEKLLAEGYAVVQQHERGRYLSEGEMRMLGRADEDGWDTLDWITKQSWSNGAVATYGCSSSAENQLKLASLAHPVHKAIVVGSSGVGIAEAGPHREGGNFWRGGVWQMGWADYFFGAMPLDWPQLPPGLSDAERTQQTATFKFPERAGIETETFNTARMHLPMIDLAKAVGAPDTEIEEYLERGPAHPAWAEDRVTNADTIKIPGLWAEAAYDISAPSGAAFFEKTRAENPAGTQSIVITNGPHCGFGRPLTQIGDRPLGDATVDWDAKVLAWLDRWVKGNTSAPAPPAVEAYMAGANRWDSFADIPTPDTTTGHVLYFSSGGKANTSAGDGVLSPTPPARVGVDRFAYDPADPVISRGGQISGMGTDQDDGAFDQREIEKRADVLVYTTPPLEADLAVFGFVTVQLAVASDAPDTDFTVKLVDVAPDGTAWNISDTIQRMRYRNGEDQPEFMRPGETYAISPPPMLVANVFRQGHRIRVEVSSSNFPTYARNLNTANDPYTSTEIRIANNQVLHGPTGKASLIILPVAKLSAP
jgi:putative CocE/NonD family hydrolase